MDSQICGVYFIRSPYHKTKRYIPFVIRKINPADQNYPVEVSTFEYKGMTRYTVNTGYAASAIRSMFLSGKLIPAQRVPKSCVLVPDRTVWGLGRRGDVSAENVYV